MSDLRKTYSWFLDFDQLGDGGDGFIECRTRDHKTANLVLQSGVSMPLVAPALGVTSASWAVRWAKVAEEVGWVSPETARAQYCLRRISAVDGPSGAWKPGR